MPTRNRREAPARKIRTVTRQQPIETQLRMLGALVYGILKQGNGVYLAVLQSTGSVKLRVYDGDDRYEDLIATTDDFPTVIADILTELYDEAAAAEAVAPLMDATRKK